MLQQDSLYVRRPWSSAREQQVTDALSEWTDIPADAARRMKPPIPNIGRTPPRFGYVQHVLGISDIARLDDVYPGSRVDFSQRQSGYSATSFPALGVI
ncbi:hypothetical protein [Streptomyces sp. WAC 06738]|uniref:hypothetical protein n=1 Tax=Streptomyces sp. WAC 06738 TaxID=2203210 RepID=UPI000F78E4FA|nr:hypothetical protein [Streptomyces sp. WAC 06738]